jgi:hypothetical protein
MAFSAKTITVRIAKKHIKRLRAHKAVEGGLLPERVLVLTAAVSQLDARGTSTITLEKLSDTSVEASCLYTMTSKTGSK